MNDTDEPAHFVVVPDLGIELLAVLNQLEELLLTLAIWEDDDAVLPSPLIGRTALLALEAVCDAVAPAQTCDEASPVAGRMFGPDGRYEHLPLRFVSIDEAQLQVLGHAARVIAGAGTGSDLDEGITQYAHAQQINRTELVGSFSRLTSVLTIVWDDDVRTLWEAVKRLPPGDDVIFDQQQEQAYGRLANRINNLWSYGSALDRFLY